MATLGFSNGGTIDIKESAEAAELMITETRREASAGGSPFIEFTARDSQTVRVRYSAVEVIWP